MIESIWSWFLHKYKQDCLGSFIIILNLPKLIMKKNYIFVQFNLFVFSIWYNSTYIFTVGILLGFTYINSHPFSRKYIPEFIWNRRKDSSSEGKFKIIFFLGANAPCLLSVLALLFIKVKRLHLVKANCKPHPLTIL